MFIIFDLRPKSKSDEIAIVKFDQDLVLETTYELVLKFGLKKGHTLSREAFQQVKSASQIALALRQGLSYLSRRIHTRKELSLKLQKKKFPPEAIKQAVQQLYERGLMNEDDYAETFITSRKRKLVGRQRLNYELAQKGVSPDVIDSAMQAAEYDEAALCVQAATKKYNLLKHLPDKNKLRQKLSQHLARKGFAWEHISQALSDLDI